MPGPITIPGFISISVQSSFDDPGPTTSTMLGGSILTTKPSAATQDSVILTVAATLQSPAINDVTYSIVYLPLGMTDLAAIIQACLNAAGDLDKFWQEILAWFKKHLPDGSAAKPKAADASANSGTNTSWSDLLDWWYEMEMPAGTPVGSPFDGFPSSIMISTNSTSSMVSFPLSKDDVTELNGMFVLVILYTADANNVVGSVGASLLTFPLVTGQ